MNLGHFLLDLMLVYFSDFAAEELGLGSYLVFGHE